MAGSPARRPAHRDDPLDAAHDGVELAFRRLIEPRSAELLAHCYRMLGSRHDAEDALQETLLRAWRALPGFGGRGLLRPWLFRIATNVCLDQIARRPRRLLPADHGPSSGASAVPDEPLVETAWLEPYPDERLGVQDGYAAPEARYEQREAIELAFVAALQHLPPRQRSVLILREVLGFSAQEVAASLQTTEAAVNSALQRARRATEERLPQRSQQATLRTLGDERVRAAVERYVDALERDDVEAIVAMLTQDATWSMPPFASWYRGQPAIVGFLLAGPMRERWRHVPTSANAQPAVGCYRWDKRRGAYLPSVLDVLSLNGDRISAVTAFVDPELFAAFGLPAAIAGR